MRHATRRTIASALAAALLGLAGHTLDAQAKARFDLPAQPLVDTLKAIASQSHLNIFFEPKLVAGRTASALSGDVSLEEALNQALAGTSLTFRRVDENTISILPATGAQDVPAETRENQESTGGNPPKSEGAVPAAGAGTSAATLWQRFRLAQATNDSPNIEQVDRSASEASGRVELDEVVVTGTHIRGAGPVGANVIVIGRDDIDATGFATVQDVLETLPQNFGASQQEVNGGAGNLNRGVSADLRGLGTGTTLTLVNGRRLAAGGDGDFVDVSSIPSSAIERIEVLTDGASAIYGSDAIGGVINIILRKHFAGVETQARYATAGGDSDEMLLSQLFGRGFGDASVLLGYQFYHRTPLAFADRDFSASGDKTPFGGSDFRGMFSNPGNILNAASQPVFAIPPGQNGDNLTAADLLPGVMNLQGTLEGSDLLARNKTHSAFFVASKRLGERLELFAEGRYNTREYAQKAPAFSQTLSVPATHPFYVNPFGSTGPVRVAYSFIDDFLDDSEGHTDTWAATLGADWAMDSSWRIVGSTSYVSESLRFVSRFIDQNALNAALADSNAATAFNPFGDGSHTNPDTLARLRGTTVQSGESTVWSTNLTANGTLFTHPAGAVRLALGADYRDERLDSTRSVIELERRISAVFAEIVSPLLPPWRDTSSPLLEVSLAGRYEEYSDFGGTFNPKVGMRLSPIESVRLRGTWSTSFRAPRLLDMSTVSSGGAPPNRLTTVFDPTRGGNAVVLVRRGNNPDLTEETSTSWSAGADLTLTRLAGMEISSSYYEIDFEDRILVPGPGLVNSASSPILVEEALWHDIILRAPPADLLATLCSSLTSGSCAVTPPVAIVDQRLRNIAHLRVRGLDLSMRLPLRTAVGAFQFGLSANYVLEHSQQLSDAAPTADLLNTAFNPVDLKLRAVASWSLGNFAANAAASYTDDYVQNGVPRRRIDSWVTADLGLMYRVSDSSPWLNGTEIAVRAVNVFDEDPPFVNTNFGFDSSNASPVGRLVSLNLRKSW